MYPTSPQYRHSIANKMYPPDNGGYVFSPILENDEPKYESGNKAIVFKVKDDKTEKTKALKLFLIDNKERFFQYLEISKFLNQFSTRLFVSFNFIEKFIYVEANEKQEENYFPGLIMEWAEGSTLGTKIQELCYKKDKNNLKKIAEKFKDLSCFLLENNIGHGDLKHDNIIVDEDNNMKLIDYDGIYVPAFNNQISKELGTDSFQHPLRKSTDFNGNIDHFSILTIYCSLIALSVSPDLYLKFNDQQNLLFTKEDFLEPDNSNLFNTLSSFNETMELAFHIKQSLFNESIYIDKLKDFLNGKFPKPVLTISHIPKHPLIGQSVEITWSTENTTYVIIENKEVSASGKMTVESLPNNSLGIKYGNKNKNYSKNYNFKGIPQPEFIEFTASNKALKIGEDLELAWIAKNYKKAYLRFEGKEIDVSNSNKRVIRNIINNSKITLVLISLENNLHFEKHLYIEVFHPVFLEVHQEKLITFPNRGVVLSISVKNAEYIILQPGNIDLSGIESYILTTASKIDFKISAYNKRYTCEFSSSIDVLTIPTYNKKTINLPNLDIKMPLFTLTIPKINLKKEGITSFDQNIGRVNVLLNKFNIFKLNVSKRTNNN